MEINRLVELLIFDQLKREASDDAGKLMVKRSTCSLGLESKQDVRSDID